MKRPSRDIAHRSVTMRDVARVAQVSQSTVSRVLNGTARDARIPEQTRSRVLAISRELGFRPNPLARGLRGAPTMLLGVVVREVTDPFFSTAIEAVSSEAAERGYNVVLGHAYGPKEEANPLRPVLETRHCDGLLLLGDMRDLPLFVADLRATSVPVVAMWQGTPLPDIPTVNVDNKAGVVAALDHLTGLGHSRIAFVAARPFGDILERTEAFLEYMRAHHLEVPPDFVVQGSNDPATGARALRSLIRYSRAPSAFVASTDQLAIGILHEAHELGVRIPDDLSVVGFDDIALAPFTVPALTTVKNPIREMARVAVEMVSGAPIDGSMTRVLEPMLVVRKSTGPYPGSATVRSFGHQPVPGLRST